MSIDISAGGFYSVCCDAEPVKVPLKDFTLEEWFHSENLEEIRDLMLQGAAPLICRRCFAAEARGGRSKRIEAWEHFRRGVYGSGNEVFAFPRARMVLYRFGNRCNLACLMCESESSTAFNSEARALDGEPEIKISNTLAASDELLKDIKIFYLGGGEPSLSAECSTLLDRLIALGHTKIGVFLNSNGTMPDSPFFQKLKAFDYVQIGFSIDGGGGTYELLRYPMTWPKLERNLNRFVEEFPKFQFNVMYTLNAVNAANLPDFLEWWDGFNRKTGGRLSRFEFNELTNPVFLRTELIPSTLRQNIISRLNSLKGRVEPSRKAVVEAALVKLAEIEPVQDPQRLAALKNHIERRAAHRGLSAPQLVQGWSELFSAST